MVRARSPSVTSRGGGVSAAPYDTRSISAITSATIRRLSRPNRARLARRSVTPESRLVWMEQIHGRNVQVVTVRARAGADAPTPGHHAPDLALVVLAADCVPVLLGRRRRRCDRRGARRSGRCPHRYRASGVGRDDRAGRAGWRTIGAFLGPAASGADYEVPAAMRADVEAHLPGSATTTRKGTPGLDLRAGPAPATDDGGRLRSGEDPRCTIDDRTLFSHRRDAPTGRLAGVIWMDSSVRVERA